MKNVKSVLAILMVLVISVCLTGCLSEEQKSASNEEFDSWFSDISYDSKEVRVVFTDKAIAELADFDVTFDEGVNFIINNADSVDVENTSLTIPDYISTDIRIDGVTYTSESVPLYYKVTLESNQDPSKMFENGFEINTDFLREPKIIGMVIIFNSHDLTESLESADIEYISITVKDNTGMRKSLTHYNLK
jgi:hypothetical protein